MSNFHSLSFKAINVVLIEKENEYNLEWTHKRHIAQSLWVCSQSLNRDKKFKSFEELYENMKNQNVKEEEKNVEEICTEIYNKFKGGE